jgi:hypothetical protein
MSLRKHITKYWVTQKHIIRATGHSNHTTNISFSCKHTIPVTQIETARPTERHADGIRFWTARPHTATAGDMYFMILHRQHGLTTKIQLGITYRTLADDSLSEFYWSGFLSTWYMDCYIYTPSFRLLSQKEKIASVWMHGPFGWSAHIDMWGRVYWAQSLMVNPTTDTPPEY